MKISVIPLDRIRADGGTQARAEINENTVAEYAEHILAQRADASIGKPLPPATVFLDPDGNYWLADGFHRHAAYKKAGLTEMPCEVRKGDLRAAVLFSCGANKAHGLRRTYADKRRAVHLLLADPEWVQWSNNAIAKACNVDGRWVGRVREELFGATTSGPEVPLFRKFIRHGKEEMQNVRSKSRSKDLDDDEEAASAADPADRDSRVEEPTPRPTPATSSACSFIAPTKDRYGITIPDNLRDHFKPMGPFGQVHAELDSLLAIVKADLAAPLTSRRDICRHLRVDLLLGWLGKARQGLIEARKALEAGRSHAVCPSCKGKTCSDCRGTGVVTETQYRELVPAGTSTARKRT